MYIMPDLLVRHLLTMRDPRAHEALHFDVKFIVKRIVSWPRYRKGMDDLTASCIANDIVRHLRLANWRFRNATTGGRALDAGAVAGGGDKGPRERWPGAGKKGFSPGGASANTAPPPRRGPTAGRS